MRLRVVIPAVAIAAAVGAFAGFAAGQRWGMNWGEELLGSSNGFNASLHLEAVSCLRLNDRECAVRALEDAIDREVLAIARARRSATSQEVLANARLYRSIVPPTPRHAVGVTAALLTAPIISKPRQCGRSSAPTALAKWVAAQSASKDE